MKELAERIYKFIETYASVSPDYNGMNQKYSNPDVISLLACADDIETGNIPRECFSSWRCSGGYSPIWSKEGEFEHDTLMRDIYNYIDNLKISNVRKDAEKISQLLGLHVSLVGVKFLFSEGELYSTEEKLSGHRYCQALMKARHGAHVLLDAEGINCPAAAAAFGFKPLPEGLKTGKGLVGFGIIMQESTGINMYQNMSTLPQGKLNSIYLFPLETAKILPDVIVVEDEIEKLMWIALASLNIKGGQRIESSTAILQAACVDATLIPYIQQKFNLSMGCYGCRDATDIGPNETLLGFPFKDFEAIVQSMEFLNQKAIPNSRGKKALAMLKRKETEEISNNDPFKN